MSVVGYTTYREDGTKYVTLPASDEFIQKAVDQLKLLQEDGVPHPLDAGDE